MVILHRVQNVKPRAPACCPRSPGPRRHRSPAQIKGRLLSALLRPPSAGSGSGVGGLGCLRINRASRAQPAPPPPGLFPAHAPMDVDLPKIGQKCSRRPAHGPHDHRALPEPQPPQRRTKAEHLGDAACQAWRVGLILPAAINFYKKKFNWIQYLPFQRFRVLFTLFSECCLTFPTRYFFAIGLPVNI